MSLEKAEGEASYDPAQTTPEAIAESVSKTGIKALVQADRCACEIGNPQGSCCLAT